MICYRQFLVSMCSWGPGVCFLVRRCRRRVKTQGERGPGSTSISGYMSLSSPGPLSVSGKNLLKTQGHRGRQKRKDSFRTGGTPVDRNERAHRVASSAQETHTLINH